LGLGVSVLVPFLRSSSIGTWDMCELKHAIGYTLQMREPTGAAAAKGSCVHKVLELGARCQVARQELRKEFREEELGVTLPTKDFCYDHAVNLAFEFYKAKEPHLPWAARDLRDVRTWTHQALGWHDGAFNPLNRRVVAPELYFDLEIEAPWAAYRHQMPDGQVIEGRLGVKGTMDLLLEVDGEPDALEYLDWKSGRRIDWATREQKTYSKLLKDKQLRLYHYAIRRLFPRVKTVYTTVMFIKDGGPFTIPFGPEDIPGTEQMLRETYEAIRDTVRPEKNVGPNCGFCHYAKVPASDDPTKSLCDFMHAEILDLGLDKVLAKRGDIEGMYRYGAGGGRSDKGGNGRAA
jgi:hypothetical protein